MKIKFDTQEEIEKEKMHIEKIYTEKAISLLNKCFWIFLFNLFTYLVFFMMGEWDFGVIFELIGFIFFIVSLINTHKKNLKNAKKFLFISMIPMLCLIIYDLFFVLANFFEYTLIYVGLAYPSIADIFLIITIALFVLQRNAYISICKANGDIKQQENIDTFYDT